MKQQPDQEILDTENSRQLQQSEQLNMQDTVRKGESRDYTRFTKRVARYLEQKNRLQPRASPTAKEKATVGIAYNGQQKVSALKEISVA